MSITGVKNIETGKVERISVELDSQYTNGHTFCEMLIDEQNGRFTAVLYGGESYTFKNNHEEFIQFLIQEFQSKGNWLYCQLRDYRLDDFVDIEGTTEALIEYIKETDEYKVNAAHYNSLEDMEEDIASILDNSSPFLTSFIWNVWDEWFTAYINDGLLPNSTELYESGFSDMIKREGDYRCKIFCEKVAPILAEVLKEKY